LVPRIEAKEKKYNLFVWRDIDPKINKEKIKKAS